jgi:hypothetical protein
LDRILCRTEVFAEYSIIFNGKSAFQEKDSIAKKEKYGQSEKGQNFL